jgi:hypothetical protein
MLSRDTTVKDIPGVTQKFGWLGSQHGTFGFGTFTYLDSSYPGWMV